jgi:hypothetical protein
MARGWNSTGGGRVNSRERGAGELLTMFGSAPTAPRPPTPDSAAPGRTESRRVNRPTAPRRGHSQPGQGWAPVDAAARMPVYQAATSEVGGLFPLLAANGVPAVGARMGYDTLSGGAFYCHPVEWVLRGSPRASPDEPRRRWTTTPTSPLHLRRHAPHHRPARGAQAAVAVGRRRGPLAPRRGKGGQHSLPAAHALPAQPAQPGSRDARRSR